MASMFVDSVLPRLSGAKMGVNAGLNKVLNDGFPVDFTASLSGALG